MHQSLALIAVVLPFTAAVVPSPVVEAAANPPLVIELDKCECLSVLQIENYVGNSDPWIISWTREEGIEHGRCSVGDCNEGGNPRPCKGSFRIQVTWPEAPTAPCVNVTTVGYRAEGSSGYVNIGQLSLSRVFVPIDHVGGTPVECESELEQGDEPVVEEDTTLAYLRMDCATAQGTSHVRYAKVREACLPCAAGTD